MEITINVPDEYISQIEPYVKSCTQAILEALVVEAYKAQSLTHAEVGQILHLNRFEVDAFLKKRDAYLHYTEKDFYQDLEMFENLQQS